MYLIKLHHSSHFSDFLLENHVFYVFSKKKFRKKFFGSKNIKKRDFRAKNQKMHAMMSRVFNKFDDIFGYQLFDSQWSMYPFEKRILKK